MANHASAEKRNRQRIRRTERNRSVKGAVRPSRKPALPRARHQDADSAGAVAAIKAVDVASKGVVHPKMAARSRAGSAKALPSARNRRPVLPRVVVP
jgi:small subunit ribosomal protein S20